ncbi:hypothetical protein EJ05DRAFT_490411 [Pseudovirgaria hyperparasitica]|uniref:Uncharacterized protein n=1 Tax=Pseudovirgaria hyperparasitica TaxID=470096 RepID=A0A6A6VTB5_9PEZI|nr:uncharacterized protein EJ05DRAFT_490411 [Pseudovirgaria hyperparasitica]KAF2752994.1 hypothetical protein EJ05DRAFT_490411 [Pseudovirgaria hyperparasitica]
MDHLTRPRRASEVKRLAPIVVLSDDDDDDEDIVAGLADSPGSDDTHISPRPQAISKNHTSGPIRSAANTHDPYDTSTHLQDEDLHLSGVVFSRKRVEKPNILVIPQNPRKARAVSTLISTERETPTEESKRRRSTNIITIGSKDALIEKSNECITVNSNNDCSDHSDAKASELSTLYSRVDRIIRTTPTGSTKLTKRQQQKEARHFHIYEDEAGLSPARNLRQRILIRAHRKDHDNFPTENMIGANPRHRSRHWSNIFRALRSDDSDHADLITDDDHDGSLPEDDQGHQPSVDGGRIWSDSFERQETEALSEPHGTLTAAFRHNDDLPDISVDYAESCSSGGMTQLFERSLYTALIDFSNSWSGYGADEGISGLQRISESNDGVFQRPSEPSTSCAMPSGDPECEDEVNIMDDLISALSEDITRSSGNVTAGAEQVAAITPEDSLLVGCDGFNTTAHSILRFSGNPYDTFLMVSGYSSRALDGEESSVRATPV